MKRVTRSGLANSSLAMFFLALVAWSGVASPQNAKTSPQSSTTGSQVTVPNRPVAPLYEGQQGLQRSEIEFAPTSRTVTIKFHVEDPNGYFLPNLRRENFAVYEDGVRQKNVTVEVEHAPVSVALLMEFGGRYHELSNAIGLEVHQVGRQLLDVLGREDKLAVFKYGDKLDTVVSFSDGREVFDRAFELLGTPGFSELNFYDALLETLNRMRDVSGRKAIIVVSTGLDTFSKATFQQVLDAARNSATPIYTIGLVHLVQRESATYGASAPFARIDWSNAEKQLEMLAKASGGRAYILESDVGIPAIYDDIMENLRVRYVISYVSSNTASGGPARQIRVELIDPKTGAALKIHDSSGKAVAARVFVQESYTPAVDSGG